MNQQSHLSLIVGPLVIVLALGSAWFAGWLALHDPVALLLTFLFFFLSFKAVKWLVT